MQARACVATSPPVGWSERGLALSPNFLIPRCSGLLLCPTLRFAAAPWVNLADHAIYDRYREDLGRSRASVSAVAPPTQGRGSATRYRKRRSPLDGGACSSWRALGVLDGRASQRSPTALPAGRRDVLERGVHTHGLGECIASLPRSKTQTALRSLRERDPPEASIANDRG